MRLGRRECTDPNSDNALYSKVFEDRTMYSSPFVLKKIFHKMLNTILKLLNHQSPIVIVPVFLILILFSWTWGRLSLSMDLQCEQRDIFHKMTDESLKNSISSSKKIEKELLILVWVWPFAEPFPLDTCQSVYGISGCKLTANRSLYSVADAVVIHHVDIMYDKMSLPQQPRPHHQRWVWFNMEPPLVITNLHFLDNLFNMTMTFRQDSDVYRPYGRIEALKEPQSFSIPGKTKLVAWVVSKWYPGVKRNIYYGQLKQHIPIDVYGKKHKQLSWDDFYQTISKYKFYLAFENSIYKDYITEKLYSNAFDSWAVPIVLGTTRKNYERFIPGDAFIHVDDFSSAEELATYLFELDRDEEKYKRYFYWRSHYRVRRETGWDNHYCKACRAIQQAPDYQIIPSIKKWFLEDI